MEPWGTGLTSSFFRADSEVQRAANMPQDTWEGKTCSLVSWLPAHVLSFGAPFLHHSLRACIGKSLFLITVAY